MHVSKLMGILAHIIRTVNHRERGERWTEKKKIEVSTGAKMRRRGARERG